MNPRLIPGIITSLFILTGCTGAFFTSEERLQAAILVLVMVFTAFAVFSIWKGYAMVYSAMAGIPAMVMCFGGSPVSAAMMGGLACLLIGGSQAGGIAGLVRIVVCPFLVPCLILALVIPATRHVLVPLGAGLACLAAGLVLVAGYEYAVLRRWSGEAP
jgi:hypothetical protein